VCATTCSRGWRRRGPPRLKTHTHTHIHKEVEDEANADITHACRNTHTHIHATTYHCCQPTDLVENWSIAYTKNSSILDAKRTLHISELTQQQTHAYRRTHTHTHTHTSQTHTHTHTDTYTHLPCPIHYNSDPNT
jgi:hypothetical protein